MRIGIDVGGTNTDAVAMKANKVLAWVENANHGGYQQRYRGGNEVASGKTAGSGEPIEFVMIGTTQFTNAFVERRDLLPVGVIRIGLPTTRDLPPMTDWPKDLRAIIGNHTYMVGGGYEFDGRILSPLNEQEIMQAAREIKRQGLRSVAISGVFSPLNDAMEKRAAEIVLQELPDAAITLSSSIGRIGILERENAAIINASLADISHHVVSAFGSALKTLGIDAPFFVSQNDGTLMAPDFAAKYPVLTFASGPTNSMRGAAYLTGVSDALVADVGGTTTDIGMLTNGFPRESSIAAEVGGVRTNFRMPDIISLGLGGGSIVKKGPPVTVGPQSVGHRLTKEALVFGGATLTTTDIAVAAGHADVGAPEPVATLDKTLVQDALDAVHRIVEDGITSMKISAAPVPLIMVGGGRIVITRELAGISETLFPDHGAVANAIGAAIGQVSGEVDRILFYDQAGRDKALADTTSEARDRALQAGAAAASVTVTEIEEIPLDYMPAGAVRLRIRTVGDLQGLN